jgi:ribosomal small subunit protein bTHX
MGKGDRRSRRGKIWRGTTGRKRPKREKAALIVKETAVTTEKKKKTEK